MYFSEEETVMMVKEVLATKANVAPPRVMQEGLQGFLDSLNDSRDFSVCFQGIACNIGNSEC